MVGDVIQAVTRGQDAARPEARVGRRIEAHAEIGSTSDRARELLDGGEADGIAVVAELQTAGRGRMGRSWTSPPGLNLTVSVGLRPRMRSQDAWQLGLAAALAMREAAHRVAPVELKWPNDLVARDGAKVGGLLAEVASEGVDVRHAVLGFGINVNWEPAAMPPEINGTATSLGALAARSVDRAELLRDLLEALETELAAVEAGRSPLDRYRAHCVTLGARVEVDAPTGRLRGIALDLDERGALLVRTDHGELAAVTSGDVARLRPDGRA